VLTSLVIFGASACQPREEGGPSELSTPTPETQIEEGELHVVELFDEVTPEGTFVQRRVPKIRARQGDRVKFISPDRSIWVLIPRAKIEQSSGGTDWAKGSSFIAFAIETGDESGKGSATVLIRSDYNVPDEEDDFAYSIIELEEGDWRYVHDESPPRMIIRKR
jgi:hypothetical protein